jgi:hypothetical protein
MFHNDISEKMETFYIRSDGSSRNRADGVALFVPIQFSEVTAMFHNDLA